MDIGFTPINLLTMKQLAVLILALFGSLILFEGCKKYPEGPAISLRSKKERVANTWKIDAVMSGGVDSTVFFTGFFNDYTLSFSKSGSYTIFYNQVRHFGLFPVTESGDWSFSSGKEDLTITPKQTSYGALPQPSTLQILKLYEKELWLRSFEGNNLTREYHFSPK